MDNDKQLTPEQWKNLKDEKQLRILKGQSLNLATEIMIHTKKSKDEVIGTSDFPTLHNLAENLYNFLKEKRWHQTL